MGFDILMAMCIIIYRGLNTYILPKILRVISFVVKKEKDYYLRKTQLLSLLIFIYKKTNKGLIEDIATGEGKSIIIASLSIYYALRNKKVDIITNGYTLS